MNLLNMVLPLNFTQSILVQEKLYSETYKLYFKIITHHFHLQFG